MPAASLHPLNTNHSPVRCPPLLRRSLEDWRWRAVFHVKHSLFGVPVARAYGRGLWVRITLAKSAIPEKAAWFVSYGILPNGLRKSHARTAQDASHRVVPDSSFSALSTLTIFICLPVALILSSSRSPENLLLLRIFAASARFSALITSDVPLAHASLSASSRLPSPFPLARLCRFRRARSTSLPIPRARTSRVHVALNRAHPDVSRETFVSDVGLYDQECEKREGGLC